MKNRALYVFIGPPGSGKGTLAQLCAQRLGREQVSTGNLCRKYMKEKTQIGQEIDFAIKSGKLVSDKLITQMVLDWFEKYSWNSPAIILDGYPRTLKQAQDFCKLALSKTFPFEVKIVHFILDEQKIIERLANRFICGNKECQLGYAIFPGSQLAPKKAGVCDQCGTVLLRRKDDDPVTIKERLKVYHHHEKELIGFLKKAGYCIYELFTDKPIEDLFEELKDKVGGW